MAKRAALAFQELGCAVEDVKVGLPDTREMIRLMWDAHYAGNYGAVPRRVPRRGWIRAWSRPSRTAARYSAEAYVAMRGRKHAYCDAVRATLRHLRSAAHARRCRSRPSRSGGSTPWASPAPWDWFPWAGFSYPFNFTGQPAATVPAGFTASGMPVGLQIVGRRLADLQVLQASAAFEQARPWAQKRPSV